MTRLLAPLDRLVAFFLWLADRIEGRPPTVMEIPMIDGDGDRCWLSMKYQPHPEERAWAMSESKAIRAAYHVHAVTLARARAADDLGWAAGWSE